MNLIYAKIVGVFDEDGMKMGRIQVGGAVKKVPLDLLTNVADGDTIPWCDGFAIGRVQPDDEEENDVSGHSR